MFEHELLRYGYFLVFAGSIVEGDATLIAAAFLAHRGYFSIPAVIGTGIVATTAANEVYFRIARKKGREALDRMAATSPKIQRVRQWVERKGPLLLFLSRFLYGLRIAIPVACGASGMSSISFFLFNLIGAFVWAVSLSLIGYAFGGILHAFWGGVRQYEWQIAGGLMLIGTLFLQWRGRKHPGIITLLLHPREVPVQAFEEIAAEARPGAHTILAHLPTVE